MELSRTKWNYSSLLLSSSEYTSTLVDYRFWFTDFKTVNILKLIKTFNKKKSDKFSKCKLTSLFWWSVDFSNLEAFSLFFTIVEQLPVEMSWWLRFKTCGYWCEIEEKEN